MTRAAQGFAWAVGLLLFGCGTGGGGEREQGDGGAGGDAGRDADADTDTDTDGDGDGGGDAGQDGSPPDFNASIGIASGAEATASREVELTLSAKGATFVELGHAADLSDATLRAFASTVVWELVEGDGLKTVFARFSDDANNQSEIVSDEIVLDTTDPVVTILEPADGALLGSSPVAVSGTVVDATAVTVSVNGEPTDVGADGAFSASVPVEEGSVVLMAEALDAAGNSSQSPGAAVDVDLTAPALAVLEPADGSAIRNSTVTVHGTVSDAHATTVSVNETTVTVANGEFYAFNVELDLGENTIDVVAEDTAGHIRALAISVLRDETAPDAPSDVTVTVDGDQATVCGSAEAGSTVVVVLGSAETRATAAEFADCVTIAIPEGATEIVVVATDAAGNNSAVTRKPLDDDVPTEPTVMPISTATTARRSLVLTGIAERGAEVRVTGGAQEVSGEAHANTGFYFIGVDLQTNWENTLSVVVVDAAGNESTAKTISVTQSEVAAPPNRLLTLASGQSQSAVENTATALPLEVLVCDAVRQPVAGVEVQFQVVGGGGSVYEATTFTATSGIDGRAHVNFTVGAAGGPPGDNLVLVDFAENEGPPVLFEATSLTANPGGATTVVGLVLGNALEPVVGATVIMASAGPNIGRSGVTDVDGSFEIVVEAQDPPQLEHVFVDPGDQPYPPMTHVIPILPGQQNALGRPIFLPTLDAVSAASDGEARSTIYPDLVVEFDAENVAFPEGSEHQVIVSPVPPLRVPMALTAGMGSNAVISVMPAWAEFDPPAAVTFPNLDGLAAGAPAQLISFDHAEGRYRVVGTARVSDDGSVIRSDVGSGIRKGAWHAAAGGVPPPTTAQGEFAGAVTASGPGGPRRNATRGDDPIELSSGAFFYEQSDVTVAGRHFDFNFERFYSSRLDVDGPLGHGWTHRYNRRLTFPEKTCTLVGPAGTSQNAKAPGKFLLTGVPVANPALPFVLDVVCPALDEGDVTYVDEQGRPATFRDLGGGSYETPSDMVAVLERESSEFLLRHPGGLVERFDQIGRLRSISERHGDTLHFGYDAAQHLVAIADGFGRVYRLGYNDDGRLATLTDYTLRRTWRYEYNSDGDLIAVTAPATDASPSGTTVQYEYLSHNMTSIKDGRGYVQLTNTYGDVPGTTSFDRVVAQAQGGHTTTLEYEILSEEPGGDLAVPASLTRVIDPVGNMHEHIFNPNGHEIETRDYSNRGVRPTDPPVYVTRRQFTATGNLVRIVQARGNVNVFAYDEDNNDDPLARGNLLRQEVQPGALGSESALVHTYSYEDRFQLVEETTDPRGLTTSYRFDYDVLDDAELNPGGFEFGDVVERTRGDETTRYRYNQFGQLIREQDTLGNISTRDYWPESKGGLLREETVDADGAALVTAYAYDAFGQMTTTTYPNKAAIAIEFNALGWPLHEVDPYGHERRFFYDDAGHVVSIAEDVSNDETTSDIAETLVTETEYDELGRVVETRVPLGSGEFATVAYTYNGAGLLSSRTSGDGTVTAYVYDERNKLAEVTVGAGTETLRTRTYAYDAAGSLTRETDPAGHETQYEYDSFDRMIAEIAPDGTRTDYVVNEGGDITVKRVRSAVDLVVLGEEHFSYDTFGRILTHQEQRLSSSGAGALLGTLTTINEYNALGQVVSTTSASGNETTLEYDGAGRVVSAQNSLEHRIEMTYGALMSPETVTASWVDSLTALNVTQTESFEYDRLGRVVARVGPTEERTEYVYDSRGLLVRETDPLGHVTQHAYDGRGLLVRTAVEVGATSEFETRYAYDARGRLTDVTGDGGGTTHMAYNALGDLVETRDALGHVTRTAYDEDGLQTLVELPSGTVRQYHYDSRHRVGAIDISESEDAAPTGSNTFVYDALGRVIEASSENDPDSGEDDVTVVLTYDSLGHVLSQEQDGHEVVASYDAAGRLQTLVDDDATLGFTYDLLDRVLSISENDTTLATNVFTGPNLAERTFGNGAVATLTVDGQNDLLSIAHRDAAQALLDGHTYGYRQKGEPAYVRRLHDGDRGDAYRLDNAGRLIAFESDATDPSLGVVSPTVEYELDGDGNRTRANTTSYTDNVANQYSAIGGSARIYDDDGRLVSDGRMFTYDGFGRPRSVDDVTYAYDAFGKLARRTGASGETRIAYWAGQPLSERDATDAVTARYFTASNDLVAADLAGERCFVHTDRQGSITGLTSGAGALVEQYRYDPFGARTVTVGESARLAFGFTGQRHDEQAGLILFRARALDPATAHFTTPDPLGAAGVGPNLYQYVGHKPTSTIDPLGLFGLEDMLGVSASDLWNAFDAGKFGERMRNGALVAVVSALDSATGGFYQMPGGGSITKALVEEMGLRDPGAGQNAYAGSAALGEFAYKTAGLVVAVPSTAVTVLHHGAAAAVYVGTGGKDKRGDVGVILNSKEHAGRRALTVAKVALDVFGLTRSLRSFSPPPPKPLAPTVTGGPPPSGRYLNVNGKYYEFDPNAVASWKPPNLVREPGVDSITQTLARSGVGLTRTSGDQLGLFPKGGAK